MPGKNANLQKAKRIRNDEFFTRLIDIEKELIHYKEHFRDKIVYCNCDDPTRSAFWMYFHQNFADLRLMKLISTHYSSEGSTYKMEYVGGNDKNIESGEKTSLIGNGDFNSQECLGILDECDIVVTNPPFSLFKNYVPVLIAHQKKFLIVGNKNAVTYREIFPLFKENKVWTGCTNIREFMQPDGSIKKFGNVGWFTNLDVEKRHEKLSLWKNYTPEEYPKYDNYMAWNVNKVIDIPCNDYIDIEINKSELNLYQSVYIDLKTLACDEVESENIKIRIKNPIWGVPISFMDKYNPEEFVIWGADEAEGKGFSNDLYIHGSKHKQCYVNGRRFYKRIFIRKR